MSERKRKRLNELLSKILEENKTLNESEMKEFKALLAELYKEKEKAKEKEELEPLSELMDRAMLISLAESALKVHKGLVREKKVEAFKRLPLDEKAKHLEKRIDEIKKSRSWHKLSKEEKDRQAKEDFDRFYEEHVRKYGNQLW
ncbi:hypothetical protein [Bacillus cytotoxicus]|uniref:hypothetical protein n=1 Tax=Bacillus cytotoxicus TaxID=580165 RepID=UPI003D7D537E